MKENSHPARKTICLKQKAGRGKQKQAVEGHDSVLREAMRNGNIVALNFITENQKVFVGARGTVIALDKYTIALRTKPAHTEYFYKHAIRSFHIEDIVNEGSPE